MRTMKEERQISHSQTQARLLSNSQTDGNMLRDIALGRDAASAVEASCPAASKVNKRQQMQVAVKIVAKWKQEMDPLTR